MMLMQGGKLHPMSGGQRLAVDLTADSMEEIAQSISFGLYDSLLEASKQPILVVSSMGAQSTGKSYQLNHLGGTLFDVSGGRCTDGIWMSLRAVEFQACTADIARVVAKCFRCLPSGHTILACYST